MPPTEKECKRCGGIQGLHYPNCPTLHEKDQAPHGSVDEALEAMVEETLWRFLPPDNEIVGPELGRTILRDLVRKATATATEVPCPVCKGCYLSNDGYLSGEACPTCKGTGTVPLSVRDRWVEYRALLAMKTSYHDMGEVEMWAWAESRMRHCREANKC